VVSVDIMAFLHPDSAGDLARIHADPRAMCEYVRPTAIDLYPTIPNLEGDHAPVLKKLASLRELLCEIISDFPDYHLGERHYLEDPQNVTFADRYRNYFLVRMDPNEYFRTVKLYSCSQLSGWQKDLLLVQLRRYLQSVPVSLTAGGGQIRAPARTGVFDLRTRATDRMYARSVPEIRRRRARHGDPNPHSVLDYSSSGRTPGCIFMKCRDCACEC
jgi:hypothetical protein